MHLHINAVNSIVGSIVKVKVIPTSPPHTARRTAPVYLIKLNEKGESNVSQESKLKWRTSNYNRIIHPLHFSFPNKIKLSGE